MAARIVPGFFLGAGVGRARRPVRPQEGDGRLRPRPGRGAGLPAVRRHGPRPGVRLAGARGASRCCGRRPRRRRSRTWCRPTTSPRPTRCRWWPPTARSRSPPACSRSWRRWRSGSAASTPSSGLRTDQETLAFYVDAVTFLVLGVHDLPAPDLHEGPARRAPVGGDGRIDLGPGLPASSRRAGSSSSSTRSCGRSTSGWPPG